MKIQLTVNGRPTTVDAPAEMPLLWVVRDLLDLKGTKFGCGVGVCGACTVHLAGAAVRSCSVPMSSIAGQAVTTIEGLADGALHAVQRAWIELDVAQCGYCQAGQVMAAVDLLRRQPNPADADIATLTNLCRCGTYPRIRSAIRRAAELMRAEAST